LSAVVLPLPDDSVRRTAVAREVRRLASTTTEDTTTKTNTVPQHHIILLEIDKVADGTVMGSPTCLHLKFLKDETSMRIGLSHERKLRDHPAVESVDLASCGNPHAMRQADHAKYRLTLLHNDFAFLLHLMLEERL